MSALETDLNPNTYIGLKLPIKNSSNLDFDMTKTSLEQSKFNITNLLLTNTGERVYQPEFGSRLINGSWSSESSQETVTNINADWERVRVEDVNSSSTNNSRFGRLRLIFNP